MKYKMIFLDLDDTLLKSDSTISQKDVEKIKKIIDIGVQVVICTGRGIYAVENILQEIGIKDKNAYVICLNGGAIYNAQESLPIVEKTFNYNIYNEVIKTAHEFDVDIQAYRDRLFLVEKVSDRVKKYILKMNPRTTIVENMESYTKPLSKILLNGSNDVLQCVKKKLGGVLGDSLNMFFSNPEFLEFTPYESTKGKSMLDLTGILGVKPKEIIAVGDNYNDMDMILLAGLGVAVGNAEKKVKEIADYITENTNNTNAVSEVIDKFILNQ